MKDDLQFKLVLYRLHRFLMGLPLQSFEFTIIKIDEFGNYLWHTGVGADDGDIFDDDGPEFYQVYLQSELAGLLE